MNRQNQVIKIQKSKKTTTDKSYNTKVVFKILHYL